MNESNFLGSGGKLAEAYAELMERMWRGKMTAFPPTHFKQVLLHNLMVVLPITTCYYLLLPLMLHDCYFYCTGPLGLCTAFRRLRAAGCAGIETPLQHV